LRHVFCTVADAARDPVAIDLIMGHSDPSMGGHYRERIDDSRLRAVSEHVRAWLFGQAPDGTTGGSTGPIISELCVPCEPPPENAGGSRTQSTQGTQKSGPVLPPHERPVLRLFAG
jgi:hypothetical protein